MLLRLSLAAAVVPLIAAACGGGVQHVLVYEKPAVGLPSWGWIWRAGPDGSHPRRVVLGYKPSVSPDGRWIAYLHIGRQRVGRATTSRASLWLVAGNGQPRRLSTDQRWVEIERWSPDSTQLLIGDDRGMEIVNRASGSTKLLVPAFRAAGPGSFSPDGRFVVYERETSPGSDVFVVPTGGGPSRRLTYDGRGLSPVWGPSSIAYCRCLGNSRGDVWLMAADGSSRRQLTRTDAAIDPFAWSRDGRRLLAYNPASHNGRLWAVDVASGRARPLTQWLGDLFPQSLSADGRMVYAAIGCGGTISPYGVLETIPFAGGRPEVIVRGPCRGSWSR